MIDNPVPRRGRPQKFPGQGARLSHGVRLKPAISEQLKAVAAENGRSIGEELELRIDRSFLGESPSSDLNGTDMNYVIAHLDRNMISIQRHLDTTLQRQSKLYVSLIEELFHSLEHSALDAKSEILKRIEILRATNNSINSAGHALFNDSRIDEWQPILEVVEGIHHSFAAARVRAGIIATEISL